MADALAIDITAIEEATFLAAILFLSLYSFRSWWTTVHGRTLAALAIGAIIWTARATLGWWHLLPETPLQRELILLPLSRPDAASFVSVDCRWMIPVAFLLLSWRLARGRVRKIVALWPMTGRRYSRTRTPGTPPSPSAASRRPAHG